MPHTDTLILHRHRDPTSSPKGRDPADISDTSDATCTGTPRGCTQRRPQRQQLVQRTRMMRPHVRGARLVPRVDPRREDARHMLHTAVDKLDLFRLAVDEVHDGRTAGFVAARSTSRTLHFLLPRTARTVELDDDASRREVDGGIAHARGDEYRPSGTRGEAMDDRLPLLVGHAPV